MNRTLQPATTLFAIGLFGLGVLAIVYHDFALDWQPVSPWVHGRTVLAYSSGVLMLGCAVGLLFRGTAVWSVRILFPCLFIWMLLKISLLFTAPGMEAVWLGFGEIVMLMTGGWILWAVSDDSASRSVLSLIGGSNGLRRALVAFGLARLPIGLSHLVYIPETVGFGSRMVACQNLLGLPDWRRANSVRPRNPVPSLAPSGGVVRSRYGEPVHLVRLAVNRRLQTDRPRSMDRLFHLLDHRLSRLGYNREQTGTSAAGNLSRDR